MCQLLVVDDDNANLVMLREMARKLGCLILTASVSDEVLPKVRTYLPDMIILDIVLSGSLNGLDITRIIKSDPDLKHIKIITVTAVPEIYTKTDALEAGCDGYMVKPFSLHNWHTTVETIYNQIT